MLELKNVSKNYGGVVQALSDISFSVGQGEIVGLFGENGAGKTTLMKSILGLQSFHGKILLDGEPVSRKNIGRLSFGTCEHSFFPRLTAKEHAAFYKTQFGTFNEKRFTKLMEFFDLSKYRPIRSFSSGMKNQFEVIMALCQGADYILLDEPFVNYDVFNREDFYKLLVGIMEPNETIILSTHLIEEVSGFIDRAVMIHKGKLLSDIKVCDLEEQGTTLIDYVKELYGYEKDRVAKALTNP